jgi:uncharacterized membrane protein
MSNLVAIAYPDEATATEVAQTLVELQKEHSIELDDLVVAIRRDNGKIKLKQSFSPSGSGAAGGALWGASSASSSSCRCSAWPSAGRPARPPER